MVEQIAIGVALFLLGMVLQNLFGKEEINYLREEIQQIRIAIQQIQTTIEYLAESQ